MAILIVNSYMLGSKQREVNLRVIVKGSVNGQIKYREEADLGEGPLKVGVAAGPIADAMQRVRKQYDTDYPFNPFVTGTRISDGWPDLTYSFHSEFE